MSGTPDAQVQGSQQQLAQELQAYIQNLPATMQAYNSQLAPAAQAQEGANASVSGQQAQLAQDVASNVLPQAAQLGSQVADQQATAGAQTASNVLGQSGQQIAEQELGIDQTANPEYYKTMTNSADQMNNLLNSIDLKGLSNGQAAAVERATNQQNVAGGNNNTASPLTTVSNALNYGNAYTAKQNQLSSALQTATGFLPQTRGNFNPIGDTLGAGATATQNTTGTGTFQGAQTNAGSNAVSGTSQSILSNASAAQQAQDQNINGLRTYPDLVNQSIGSL